MLPLLSILVGVSFLAIFSLVLWVMLARPTHWSRFTQREHEFWVRRGLPIRWAETIRDADRGWGLKLLVALTIIMALILTVTAIILRFILHLYA